MNPAVVFVLFASPSASVEWKEEWPRFSQWEAVATLGGTAANFVAQERLPEPTHTRFSYEVPLLDDGTRFLLRGRTEQTQNTFGRYSDVGFRTMAYFPYVDAALALAVHRNADVAAQMALIDMQALTLASLTQLFAARLVGRARPYAQDCNPFVFKTLTRECGGENDNKSFFSGHTTTVFTGAGLTCIHHENLPLYGGGAADRWACIWALGIAAATGTFRVVSDAHYVSDVLVGAGVGWFYGYLMPKWLHYRDGNSKARDRSHDFFWAPSFTPVADGGVLGASATF